jgi:hypothetical protein
MRGKYYKIKYTYLECGLFSCYAGSSGKRDKRGSGNSTHSRRQSTSTVVVRLHVSESGSALFYSMPRQVDTWTCHVGIRGPTIHDTKYATYTFSTANAPCIAWRKCASHAAVSNLLFRYR